VVNANRAPLDGWTVVVRNQTRGWERAATTGIAGGHGVYSVLRTDSSAPVAEVGDTITVTAKHPDRAHVGETTHTVTERELEQAHASVWVSVPSLASQVSIVAPETGAQLGAGSDSVTLTVDMGDHVSGWSWWLDDPSLGATGSGVHVPSGDRTTVVGLHDRSTHTIYVGLTNGARGMLAPDVIESVTVSVGAAPQLSVASPAPGEVFPGGTTSVPLVVDIVNPIGGWHWRLDEPLEDTGAPGGVVVRGADGDTIEGLRDGVSTVAHVTLIDERGLVLDPPVAAAVQFFVAPAPPVAVLHVGGEDVAAFTTGASRIEVDGSASWDADGAIARYDWEFGDGSVAVGAVVAHDYAGPGPFIGGTYTVTLTVTDDDGQTATDTLIAKVGSGFTQGPTPRVTPKIDISRHDPLELNALERSLGIGGLDNPLATVGEHLTFDASRSSARFGQLVDFRWDFGDGATSGQDLAGHAFTDPGVRYVTLTATDDLGFAATASFMLLVLPTIVISATSQDATAEEFAVREGEVLDIQLTASDMGSAPVDLSVELGELAQMASLMGQADASPEAQAALRILPDFDQARDDPYMIVVSAATEDDVVSTALSIAVREALPWDVNGDDVIDIVDLVSVAWDFGSVTGAEGPPLPGDVTRDGVVNIVDLVFVAAHFGESLNLAAPAKPGVEQAPMVKTWLAEAEGVTDRGEEFRRGVANLKALVPSSAPAESALHPNYPNPFNPETWIPFQLAEGGEVTLTIFDARGRAVRRIRLGAREAGYHDSPERAAHWDGRNDHGEEMASGAYFVEFRAEDYREVRRLTLLK